jgi:hypothetical protein
METNEIFDTLKDLVVRLNLLVLNIDYRICCDEQLRAGKVDYGTSM